MIKIIALILAIVLAAFDILFIMCALKITKDTDRKEK